MSAGDPHHDHGTCGGTTSVLDAQRQTNLMAEILSVGMTSKTKSLRFGFTNARSGPVDFNKPLSIITSRCDNLRYLDLTFATDTLMPTKPGAEAENFNTVFARECLTLCKQLATINQINTLKLLMCTKEMLKEISKCSKLKVLEIIEASVRICWTLNYSINISLKNRVWETLI